MPSSSASRLALPLALGLACGALGGWTLRRAAPSAAHSPEAAVASPAPAASAPALILPPRITGVEADAALDTYLTLPPLPPGVTSDELAKRRASLRVLLTLLPPSHFDRLLTALAKRAGAPEALLRDIAFGVWIENDAPAAARWAFALTPDENIDAAKRSRYAADAALAWAESAFDDAYSWVSALPDSPLAREVATKLLSHLAATDPRRALALAGSRDETFLAAAQQEIFLVWIKKDPASAFTTLGAEMFELRANIWKYEHPLAEWAKRDPRAALEWIASPAAPALGSANSPFDLILRLVTNDSPAAAAFAKALAERPNLPDQLHRLTLVLSEWKDKSPAAALAWLRDSSDLPRRTELLESLADYSKHNRDRPDINLSVALLLPTGKNRDTYLSTALSDWAVKDPDSALAWLREHEKDPSLAAVTTRAESALLAGAAVKLVATDPAAALAHWDELPAGVEKSAAALTVAEAWARHDPAAASRWFAGQLSPSANATAQFSFQSMIQRWAKKDPEAALRWADTHSDKTLQKTALRALGDDANLEFYSQGENRARLVSKIQDPDLRSEILSQHLQVWLRHDYRAARAWLESTDTLSPEQAARLLDKSDPARRR